MSSIMKNKNYLVSTLKENETHFILSPIKNKSTIPSLKTLQYNHKSPLLSNKNTIKFNSPDKSHNYSTIKSDDNVNGENRSDYIWGFLGKSNMKFFDKQIIPSKSLKKLSTNFDTLPESGAILENKRKKELLEKEKKSLNPISLTWL